MRDATGRRLLTGLTSAILLAAPSAAPLLPAAAQAVSSSGISPFYRLSVVAKSGDAPGFGHIGNGVSINGRGTVAFAAEVPGGEGVFVADGTAAPRNIAGTFLSATRTFGEAVQVNDVDQVVARVRKQGSPVTYQLYRFNADATFTQIATGGPSFSPVDVVLSHPSINDAGRVVFGGQCFSRCSFTEGLMTPKVEGSSSLADYHATAMPIPLRPLMTDDGRIVIRDAATSSIVVLAPDFDPGPEVAVACPAGKACAHPGFSQVGRAPGIGDTGTVVAFAGDRGNGPGIFLSIDEGGARRLVTIAGERWNGASCRPSPVNDPAGLLGFAANGDLLCLRDVDLDARVGVVLHALGAPGIDDDRITVAFVATPSGPGRDNPAAPGTPFLFSADKGLFTADLRVTRELRTPADRAFVPGGPRKVVQVGDVIAGRRVGAVTLQDPLTVPTTDDAGAARAARAGDHRLAFHVATDVGDMVLRATHLDTDQDGLLDHWETGGLDADGDGAADLDLAAMGADPAARDLFLEVDWVRDRNGPLNAPTLHEPAPGTAARLDAMFLARGIRLHIDAGPGADRGGDPFSRNMGSGPLQGGDRIGMRGDPGTAPDVVYHASPGSPPTAVAGVALRSVDDIKSTFFGSTDRWARELVFHYAVLGDNMGYTDTSGRFTLTAPLQDSVLAAANGAPPSVTLATTMIPNDPATGAPFDLSGDVVKITAGTGAGQLRTIVANTDVELFVARPWAVVPDATSRLVGLSGHTGRAESVDLPGPDNPLPGNDLVVALGTYAHGGVRPDVVLQWRTLAHELGHTLALRHCGAEPAANACSGDRVNYMSLMSYAHQLWRGSPVQSYSGGAPFDDWAHVRLDFQSAPLFLGNSFLSDFGAVPLDIEPEPTLADYIEANPGLDAIPPSATITAPAPGTPIGIGGNLTVTASAADDVAVDSVLVSFDLDGDGTLDGPGEIATAVEQGPGSFEAVFEGVDGPPGGRTVQVSPADAAGNVGLAAVEVAVKSVAALASTGPASGTRGERVTLRARLADAGSGDAIPGAAVEFRLGSIRGDGVTDEAGEARVEMRLDLEPKPYQLELSFAGDDGHVPAAVSVPFEVRWEHTFVDDGGAATVYLNPSTHEFLFAAPGDVSAIRQDPGMQVDTLPNGQRVVTIAFSDPDIAMIGQFHLDADAFVALVRTTRGAYALRGT